MYSNLVLLRIGIRALLTTVLASLWECQPPAEQGKPPSDAVCHFPVFFLLLPPVCFSQSKKSINSVLAKQGLAKCGKHIPQSLSTSGEDTGDPWTGLGEAASHLQQHKEPAEGCVLRGKTGNHWPGQEHQPCSVSLFTVHSWEH